MPTCTECSATVQAITPQGIVLDRSVFYPLGGGQAGDTGVLVQSGRLAGSVIRIVDTRKGKDAEGHFTSAICHLPDPANEPGGTAAVGDTVLARIDWQRRHRLMRLHTTTHLLCHLVPQLVNGCSITPDYARLDFNMTDPLDKDTLTAGIAAAGGRGPSAGRRRHHRRRAGRQPGAGQEHERAAPARQRQRAHHPHRWR
jgi:misacylated tRNA(Ala) deacylase